MSQTDKVRARPGGGAVGLLGGWGGQWGGLGVLLLDEGIGDGLHAVLRTDEHHRGAPAHYQAQLPCVLR